jgi:glycosyltransferase involved in cell wall biosynthesis
MNIKISVIIPVYNSEQYIKNCLDSIVNQSYNNIEIIIVNDGSTDSSLSICKSYAKKDDRIIILDKENKGQASARNLGLESATGDLISFVDSDDAISTDLFLENIEIYKSNTLIDVIQFPVYYNYMSKNAILRKIEKKMISSKELLYDELINKKMMSWIICDKLFKKEVFENLRFPNGMIYEDNFLIIDILSRINYFYYSDKGVYYYYMREKSTTNSGHSEKKEIDTQKVNLHLLKNIIKTRNTSNIIICLNKIINIYQSLYVNYNFNGKIDELFRLELKKIKIIEILKSNLFLNQKIKTTIVKIIGVNLFLNIYIKFRSL